MDRLAGRHGRGTGTDGQEASKAAGKQAAGSSQQRTQPRKAAQAPLYLPGARELHLAWGWDDDFRQSAVAIHFLFCNLVLPIVLQLGFLLLRCK